MNAELKAAIAASFLARLPPDAVAPLLEGAERLALSAGTRMGTQLGGAYALGLTVSGLIRNARQAPDGRSVTIRYERRGDVGGLAGAFYRDDVGIPTSSLGAYGEALEQSVQYRLPSEVWREAARRDGRAAYAILTEVSRIFRLTTLTLTDSSLLSMRQRVARELLLAAGPQQDDGALAVALTQQQLADGVGSAREVVARALAELRERGAIATHRHGIVVLDAEALRAALTTT